MKMRNLAVRGAGRTNYIGPTPEEEIGGRLAFRKIPSEAWRLAHPDGADEPPTDAEMVVQCVVMGIHRWPSRLKVPAQWDEAQFPIVELACVPYLDWMHAANADRARKKGEGPPTTSGESIIDTVGDDPVIESVAAVDAPEVA
jgi:uncharacterized protein YbdZ (MbtH family)